MFGSVEGAPTRRDVYVKRGWPLELFEPALYEEDDVSRTGLVHAGAGGNV
jgi:hypothetical protein